MSETLENEVAPEAETEAPVAEPPQQVNVDPNQLLAAMCDQIEREVLRRLSHHFAQALWEYDEAKRKERLQP